MSTAARTGAVERRAAGGGLRRRAQRVRLVALDVDGVLTDGRLYFGARGEAMKAFDVRDGLGIELLREAGIEVAIITGRRSAIVVRRARELGIARVLQGQKDKLSGLRRVLRATGIAPEQCAYMGDDWPDLAAMALAGLAATVSDGAPEVRACAHWVARCGGGRGAVREFAQFLLQAQGRLVELLAARLEPGGAAPGARRAPRRTGAGHG
jgi:3-deoxy-D-manno-octulosonate 8-phosphate phosphatase (KDO 8-P phosphatase)